MGPGKLYKVLLLGLTIQLSHQQEIDCSHSANCNQDPNIAAITCRDSGGSEDCGCKGTSCGDIDLNGVLYADVDDVWCTGKCTGDIACKYWKFDKQLGHKYCYLMDKDGCKDEKECLNDDRHHCKSGVVLANEPQCEGESGTTTTTTEPTPPPTCPGPFSPPDTSTNKFFVTWICFNQNPYGIIDMYEATEMNYGGYCLPNAESSGGSCKPNTYMYECKTSQDGITGEWKRADAPDHDDGIAADKTLKNIDCTPHPLEFSDDLANQDGRQIFCENEGMVNKKIQAENECIMLCDGFALVKFYTDWKADGSERTWFFELIDDPDSKEELSVDMLDCWNKR